ncbi:cystatin-like [Fundulus diaphanus]
MLKIVFAIFAAVVAVGQCLPGGFNDVDVNDQNFKDALNFAVAFHNHGTEDQFLHLVANIISAKVQVVTGFNYIIVVTLGRTDCKKGKQNMGCTVYSDPDQAQIHQCTFTVFSPLTSDGFQLLGQKCYYI